MMASMAAAPRRAAALLAGVLTFSSTAALASLLACLPAATKAGLVWLADSMNLGAAGEAANMSSSLADPSSALDMFAAVPASLLPFLAAGAAALSSATLVFLADGFFFSFLAGWGLASTSSSLSISPFLATAPFTLAFPLATFATTFFLGGLASTSSSSLSSPLSSTFDAAPFAL